MDAHELSARLKALALELGRTPQRDEFISGIPNGRSHIDRAFGSWAVMLEACGLESPKRQRKEKITNAIFETDIHRHLEEYRSEPKAEPVARAPWPKIAIISDIHWPFENQRVIDAFYDFIQEFQPEHVIINGDAWDMYSHSKYPRSHNIFTPKDEESLSREKNETFWLEVKKRCPKAKCYQNLGNHSVRPLKRVLESAPTLQHWVEAYFRQLLSFDGVETNFDPRHELEIGDILIFHGYRTQLGAHRDYTMRNCINGHTHRGGVVFRQVRGQVIWELNSGVAGDPYSQGLSYTPQKIVEWTPGFGAVDHLGPRFIVVR